MDERELPSDSDSSDEDFVPDGVDSDLPSEEDSGPEDAELETGAGSGDDEPTSKSQKRSAKGKRGGKRKRLKKNCVREAVEEAILERQKAENIAKEKLTEEEEKKKADSLWADFMKDVGGPVKKPCTSTCAKVEVSTTPSSVVKTSQPKASLTEKENKDESKVKENKAESKVTITKIFEFAGEEVKVTKEVPVDSPEARLSEPNVSGASRGGSVPRGRGRGGGLSAVLSQIGKKSKISTLEKSKLDWERYKSEEGLTEEIQTHNRGKDGYLEKQDFLERTDLRQFEIEKQLRASRRSNR